MRRKRKPVEVADIVERLCEAASELAQEPVRRALRAEGLRIVARQKWAEYVEGQTSPGWELRDYWPLKVASMDIATSVNGTLDIREEMASGALIFELSAPGLHLVATATVARTDTTLDRPPTSVVTTEDEISSSSSSPPP